EKTYEEIVIHDQAWYAANRVTLRSGEKVIAIDRSGKTVTTEAADVVAYDKLLIATGSDPIIIPIPGRDLPGVVTYRDLDDVEAMLAASRTKARAVVIG